MAIIEFALEVRETPSEVLRRLQNSTLSQDAPDPPEDGAETVAETSLFQVTAVDGTPVEIQADAVVLVREL